MKRTQTKVIEQLHSKQNETIDNFKRQLIDHQKEKFQAKFLKKVTKEENKALQDELKKLTQKSNQLDVELRDCQTKQQVITSMSEKDLRKMKISIQFLIEDEIKRIPERTSKYQQELDNKKRDHRFQLRDSKQTLKKTNYRLKQKEKEFKSV